MPVIGWCGVAIDLDHPRLSYQYALAQPPTKATNAMTNQPTGLEVLGHLPAYLTDVLDGMVQHLSYVAPLTFRQHSRPPVSPHAPLPNSQLPTVNEILNTDVTRYLDMPPIIYGWIPLTGINPSQRGQQDFIWQCIDA